MGGKTREIIFPETHEYREKKRWKEIVWKKCENTFFINTRISRPKNVGGTPREKNVSRNIRISRATKMEKNLLEKVRKQVFYKHTNVVTIKWKKTREKFIPETRISRPKNDEKIVWKKYEIRFSINTYIS